MTPAELHVVAGVEPVDPHALSDPDLLADVAVLEEHGPLLPGDVEAWRFTVDGIRAEALHVVSAPRVSVGVGAGLYSLDYPAGPTDAATLAAFVAQIDLDEALPDVDEVEAEGPPEAAPTAGVPSGAPSIVVPNRLAVDAVRSPRAEIANDAFFGWALVIAVILAFVVHLPGLAESTGWDDGTLRRAADFAITVAAFFLALVIGRPLFGAVLRRLGAQPRSPGAD